MTNSSTSHTAEVETFDSKDYPSLIKKFLGNYFAAEWIIGFIFLVLVGAWWILAYQTYDRPTYEAISFLYTFSPTSIIINNLFAYVAVLAMIFLPGRSKQLLIQWLNDKEKINVPISTSKGKKVDGLLNLPNKYFRFIVLGTLIIVVSIGALWHYLKNLTPVASTINPFYDAWVSDGIEIREFADGPIPSAIHTTIVALVTGIVGLYALDMIILIFTFRKLATMISDDLAHREINPYHSDRMGGLKPYSTFSILLSTYNGLPYLMLIPFIFQYITTNNLITQLISIFSVGGIFFGIGLVIWIMMVPLDNALRRFKEKFDRKVYDATESPRFANALDMVLADAPATSPEENVYFTATLSLWSVTANLRSSVFDMDELKRALIKIAGPVAGFLIKVILEL